MKLNVPTIPAASVAFVFLSVNTFVPVLPFAPFPFAPFPPFAPLQFPAAAAVGSAVIWVFTIEV